MNPRDHDWVENVKCKKTTKVVVHNILTKTEMQNVSVHTPLRHLGSGRLECLTYLAGLLDIAQIQHYMK